MEEIIEVFADWQGLPSPEIIGFLRTDFLRGKEIFSFEYAESWLKKSDTRMLDPDLQLFKGTHYLNKDKINFGLFLDSSPDRWGKILMQRREQIIAKKENRKSRVLTEKDFLLGVFDESRMGALRFKISGKQAFENSDSQFSCPPWTRLRELENASFKFESEENSKALEPWLALLLAPGSSLGGARPKASILDEKSSLWIGKFPSKHDTFDSGAWEMLCAILAKRLDLNMSEVKCEKLSRRGHTFLTKRFDRVAKTRIHFASAMTLLARIDGDNVQKGASYLEMAEFLIRFGAQASKDLAELWKRIVFYIAVGNTDDHLRNHGFLLTDQGWVLSPCYDINPNPMPFGLSLAIDETNNSLDFDLALSVAEFFRVSLSEAKNSIDTTKKTVSQWALLAKELGIKKSEVELMEGAFLF